MKEKVDELEAAVAQSNRDLAVAKANNGVLRSSQWLDLVSTPFHSVSSIKTLNSGTDGVERSHRREDTDRHRLLL
jgi:hypothetical protein